MLHKRLVLLLFYLVLLECCFNFVLSFYVSSLRGLRTSNNKIVANHYDFAVDTTRCRRLCQTANDKNGDDWKEKKMKNKSKAKASSVNEELLDSLQERLNYPSRIVIPGGSCGDVEDDGQKHQQHRCGFVSIIGAPNMGKSTLLNALLEHPLCIATSRPQTTRHAILGLLSSAEQNCQLCFLDTPGVIKDPAYKLQEGMMEAVKGALKDADVFVVVTDLFSTPIEDDVIFSRLRQTDQPLIVVVNKIDLVERINPEANVDETGQRTITVEDAVRKWRNLLPQAMAIIPLSASEGIHNVGVEVLRRLLVGGPDTPEAFRNLGRPIVGMFPEGIKTIDDETARAILPNGPPLYETDALTDRNERFFASEIIRGALFRKLGKELPYCCEVRIEDFQEPKEEDRGKAIIRMNATILVERDTQKGIVVGKGGKMIRQVGMDAREQLEDFLQQKVYLNLNVKVDKDWRKDTSKLKQYGYMK